MKYIKIISLVWFLSSCGFQPLYVQQSGNSNRFFNNSFDTSITQEMAQIKIASINDRFGQQLRNNLLDLLTPKGAPQNAKYRLVVKILNKRITQQAMRDDVTATNERINYKIGYQLFSSSTLLLSGNSMAFVSYDILSDPYSTTMSQKKAEQDAAKIIADDIALRLGTYFHSQHDGVR